MVLETKPKEKKNFLEKSIIQLENIFNTEFNGSDLQKSSNFLPLFNEFSSLYPNQEPNPIDLKSLIYQYQIQSQNDINQGGIGFTLSGMALQMVKLSFFNYILGDTFQNLSSELISSDQRNQTDFFDQFLIERLKKNQNQPKTKIFHVFHQKFLDPAVGSGIFPIAYILLLLYLAIEIKSKNGLLTGFESQSIESQEIIFLLKSIDQLFSIETNINQFVGKLQSRIMELKQEDQIYIFNKITQFLSTSLFFSDRSLSALKLSNLRIKSLLLTCFNVTYIESIRNVQIYSECRDYLNSISKYSKKYDLIILNPPYLGSDQFHSLDSEENLKLLKQKYKAVITPRNKVDLYFFFIYQSILDLNPNGIFTFIVPNRLLTSSYARNLRKMLFKESKLRFCYDFEHSLQIFPDMNVHPCIISGMIRDLSTQTGSNSYFATLYQKSSHASLFFLIQSNYIISEQISMHYNIIFSHFDKNVLKILEKSRNWDKIGDYIQIHEGIRLAHIKSQIPETLIPKIAKLKYDSLSIERRKDYFGEIRGKNIDTLKISDATNYIAFPIQSKRTFIQNISSSLLLIQELGSNVNIAFLLQNEPLRIPYGGIYFIGENDIISHQGPKLLKETLIGYISLFKSNYFKKLYSCLFGSTAWGSALKFRSSYISKIPLPPVSHEKFIQTGMIYLSLSDIIHNFNKIKPQHSLKYYSSLFSQELPNFVDFIIYSSIFSINKEKLQKVTLFLQKNILDVSMVDIKRRTNNSLQNVHSFCNFLEDHKDYFSVKQF